MLQPLATADPSMSAILKERGKQLAELRLARDRAETGIERLKKSPNDAAAHTTVGEFLCFVRGDSEHGLVSLAQSDDPALGLLAKRDLLGLASDPNQQVSVGDSWWNLADSKNSPELFKAGIRQRAVFWYIKAIASGQVTGLSRTVVEKADRRW